MPFSRSTWYSSGESSAATPALSSRPSPSWSPSVSRRCRLAFLCPRRGPIRFNRADPRPLGPRRPARRAARGADRAGDRALPDAAARAWQVGRITFEILRPVRSRRCGSRPRSCGPGARWSCSSATLATPRARSLSAPRPGGWRPRPSSCPTDGPARRARADPRPGGAPSASRSSTPARTSATTPRWSTGSSRAASASSGPATVWMRMRDPLVAGEEPTPLQRVLVAADSGNGVSATLDLAALHLHQRRPQRPPAPPAGRRVGLPRRDHAARAERRRARRHGALRRARPDRPRAADAAGARALTLRIQIGVCAARR